MGSRTVVYSLVMGLWLAEISLQYGSGPVGSRTVVYSLLVRLWVVEQYYTVRLRACGYQNSSIQSGNWSGVAEQ